jgi:hypothetical protein
VTRVEAWPGIFGERQCQPRCAYEESVPVAAVDVARPVDTLLDDDGVWLYYRFGVSLRDSLEDERKRLSTPRRRVL